MTDFDTEFDALPSASTPTDDNGPDNGIGVVLAASRKEVVAQLYTDVDPESINIGSYAVVDGSQASYLCMVSDVHPDSNLEIVRRPLAKPGTVDNKQRSRFTGAGALWSDVTLNTHLARQNGEETFGPVRNVPGQLRLVRKASQDEINAVFGDASKPGVFHVGSPLDMPGMALGINIERLVQRSVAVFGQSGTGKTFLSRLLLAGVIRERAAASLIFDMHNEYGWEGTSESGPKAKGLKQLFPTSVSIFTLDDESSRRRGSNPDVTVSIGMDKVEPEDIEALQSVLNLSEPQIGAAYALHRHLGPSWLARFLDDKFIERYGITEGPNGMLEMEGESGMKALAHALDQPMNTMSALRRRFERMRRYGFLVPHAHDDVIGRLMKYLDAGTSVVLEFGRYGNSLDAYMFVANFITRRLHAQYIERKERSFGGQGTDPTPLMIVIEEAHKFLDPAVVNHTIFGTIARELRKYNVTLFVIDQRPSKIDKEVMSQIATRVTALLTESNDIGAVLDGVRGEEGLREVLARLDTRQQVLIIGHAVPIPVVVQTRTYDVDFYKSMGWRTDEENAAQLKINVAKMRGPEDFNGFD